LHFFLPLVPLKLTKMAASEPQNPTCKLKILKLNSLERKNAKIGIVFSLAFDKKRKGTTPEVKVEYLYFSLF